MIDCEEKGVVHYAFFFCFARKTAAKRQIQGNKNTGETTGAALTDTLCTAAKSGFPMWR